MWENTSRLHSEQDSENINIVELPADTILITECSAAKTELDKAFWVKTRREVRDSILDTLANNSKSNKNIPPIIVLWPPPWLFSSKELTKAALLEVLKMKKGDIEYIDYYLELIYKGIDEGRQYVCYNGNTRLEAFQENKSNVRSHVISSWNDFANIPENESLDPKRFWSLYGTYELCYMHLLLNAYSSQVSEKRINDYFS